MLDAFNGGVDVFLWPDTEKFYDLIIPARYVEHGGFNMAIWPFISNVKKKQVVVVSFGSASRIALSFR